MKKIFQLIVSIPHDKLLHIIAGMIVVMLVLRLVSFIGIPGMIARIIALIAVILTGVLREVYNKKHGGVFDKKDLYATISGGLIVLLLTVNTKWQLSPEELERVKETGTIHLSMLTFNQPLQPVLLTVDLPTEK